MTKKKKNCAKEDQPPWEVEIFGRMVLLEVALVQSLEGRK